MHKHQDAGKQSGKQSDSDTCIQGDCSGMLAIMWRTSSTGFQIYTHIYWILFKRVSVMDECHWCIRSQRWSCPTVWAIRIYTSSVCPGELQGLRSWWLATVSVIFIVSPPPICILHPCVHISSPFILMQTFLLLLSTSQEDSWTSVF